MSEVTIKQVANGYILTQEEYRISEYVTFEYVFEHESDLVVRLAHIFNWDIADLYPKLEEKLK